MLELQNLSIRYETFSLHVTCNIGHRVTGIFGPSGSGKTTLLELLSGVRKPHTGKISFHGEILSDSDSHTFVPPEMRRIGYVPQDLALFPHLSVRENIYYSKPKENNAEFFTSLQIEPLLDQRVQQLSGGEKQRVALVRALLSRPRLLLLDEPLSSLDEPLRERTRQMMAELIESIQIPVLYVSHDSDEIVHWCTDVVIFEKGRIVSQGPPSELFVIDQRTHYKKK